MGKVSADFYSQGLFANIKFLELIYGDDYGICCPQLLPVNVNPSHCHTSSHLISDCRYLIRYQMLRLSFYFLVFSEFIGFVMLYLLRNNDFLKPWISSFSSMVIILFFSDIMMAVYLIMILTANAVFEGDYILNDHDWRNSVWCKSSQYIVSFFLGAFFSMSCVHNAHTKFPF